MFKILISVLILLVCGDAFAAGGAIPFGFIKLQAINFLVFVGILYYLNKTKIAPVLKQAREDYILKSTEAERKLKEVQAERDELNHKLKTLKETYDQSLSEAKDQAESKYKTKILEVKDQAAGLNKDLEVQLASLKREGALELKESLMEKSVKELKEEIGSDFDEAMLAGIQNKFVDRVGVRL